ncbi:Leucine-, isoleucine-, valine-, threonine-, and alanine-binding protein [uncultured spirochete]|jgi:branched-chain amino acid transport system substrate-binding protein|uniref:Leucine-, isoleucine-, valine-, threonine-, and alanine-binding protein n=1 Tax=uncultured spirochete TaxID=156406 RepID=A0A3P3XKZ3_9SPIR|nr:ABC transporter substrate-binding protein [Rectinema subterraneum]SLM15130.1 Leucine-, isoleucine-, valine-, threonine-, and alanine-binding protein [uncultured spirochete]HBE46148.1 ABC transporter substrate-binding protein [Spirochaetaceae bacterium]HCX97344.1 ABC transporter substrate-binding protein [Spirochaetaceae bacterium]
MKRMMLVLAVLVLFAGSAFAQGTTKLEGTIKLGGIWTLADITGKQGSAAAQLAVDEINAAGGVLGKKLELIVVDDEGKADKAAAAVEKLATVDKVDVFVGGMASGAELGKIPAFKKYGKVVMSTGAAGSATVEKALGPSPESDFYFHLHPWDYNQGASYAEGWDAIQKKYPQIQIKKIFLAYEEGAFGKSSWDATKVLFGSDKRYTIDGASFKSALLGGGDYTAVLEAAKAFKPDLFIWAGYDADALPMLEQAKAMKFSPGIYLGAPPGWPIGFGSSKLARNVMLYGMWSPAINDINPVSAKFYKNYIAKYREEPATYFAPLAYSAVYIVAEGIKAAGTTETGPLVKALEQTKYVSPLGEVITFKPSNIIKHQGITRQKILQWQNGIQEVIWPFETATAEPVYPFPAWK